MPCTLALLQRVRRQRCRYPQKRRWLIRTERYGFRRALAVTGLARVNRTHFMKQGADMDSRLNAWAPQLLSVLRIITGLTMFQFGVAKIFKLPVLPYFADLPPLIVGAGMLELVLGALLLVGLFSRIAAFILSGEMAFAYFLGHMFKTGAPVFLPLNNGGTLAMLFCFTCLYLAAAGAGPWSLDATLRGKT